jgi:leucyl aminopeptidase (aminopeptidase T)
MAAARPELTPQHRALFRAFVRLVHELDQCRFMRQYKQQDHTVSRWLDADGEAKTSAPNYDWEDFRSFMTIFRKIGIATKEPTHLAKVYKLAGRYASDAFRERLGTARSQVMAVIFGAWTGMQVGGQIDGKEVTYSTAELLDMVTNGMIFHEDAKHRQALELFSSEPHWAFLWPTIHFKIMPIRQIAVMLFHDLWRDGILSEADYPAEWQAAKLTWESSKSTAGAS